MEHFTCSGLGGVGRRIYDGNDPEDKITHMFELKLLLASINYESHL
jgi:hypothetical protein